MRHAPPAPRIGVLALQGCVEPHRAHLEAAGATMHLVLTPPDLDNLDGLILPGGESSTMLTLMDAVGLFEPLQRACERLPVWGICAGSILLARSVSRPAQRSLGVLDIDVERNSYGRQLQSSFERVAGEEVAFIRAPRISRVGSSVQVLGLRGDDAVWVATERCMATTFHPELAQTRPSAFHRRWVEQARSLS